MEAKTSICVREYIDRFYRGGLIGISDLADYCQIMEGEIYITLLDMQSNGELRVIKRYFCPEFHPIQVEEQYSYCQDCEFNYPNDQIEVAVYVCPQNSNT
jgi:hypothetical protein